MKPVAFKTEEIASVASNRWRTLTRRERIIQWAIDHLIDRLEKISEREWNKHNDQLWRDHVIGS